HVSPCVRGDYFLYFASHIPITLCIDLQALLPAQVYPQWLKDLVQWYAGAFRDPMVVAPPAWFGSFIVCEALLQLPFFLLLPMLSGKVSPVQNTPMIVDLLG
uniref:EXPERA domain-containing protein n=1 Tax=Sphaeramia orbicularis TaxID=375764 RepID=A0A672Y993_9TELE